MPRRRIGSRISIIHMNAWWSDVRVDEVRRMLDVEILEEDGPRSAVRLRDDCTARQGWLSITLTEASL